MRGFGTMVLGGVLFGSLAVGAIAQPVEPQTPPGGAVACPGGVCPDGRMHGMGMLKHIRPTLRVFANQANGNVYTMAGIEMMRPCSANCWGGFGMYKGMNLGDTTSVDATYLAGGLVGAGWGMGPMILGVGALLGGGMNLTVSRTVTFSNFSAFFAAEPRVSISVIPMANMGIGLSAGWLFTTRPADAAGPSVMATLTFTR